MRMEGGRESRNVEDRRGQGGGLGGGGMRGGRPRGGMMVGGGLGTVVLVVLALLFGCDPSVFLSGSGPMPQQAPSAVERPAQRAEAARRAPMGEDEAGRFARRVLAETEDVWNPIFQSLGRRYEEPVLVLYSDAVRSACGVAQAQVGPFYGPGDNRLYIDLDFMADLQRQVGARGDFAAAYIIAHEVGHHVQNQLGVLDRVEQLKRQAGTAEANALQVRVELQADCLAGLWARRAHEARRILEPGDIEEGLNAAAAVGDDRLQRQSRGHVAPDSFTHGTSAQRARWFRAGFESGRLEACDTFAPERL